VGPRRCNITNYQDGRELRRYCHLVAIVTCCTSQMGSPRHGSPRHWKESVTADRAAGQNVV
jgi:hypothetical protein